MNDNEEDYSKNGVIMRVTLKVYVSKIKMKITEKKYIVGRKISKKWDSFLHWGHEKLTIMLIPHNERKIFNFQISKFTVGFFIVLFAFVIATSAFAVKKNQEIKKDEKNILMKYQTKQAQLIRMQELSLEIRELYDSIKPEIREIYAMTSGNQSIPQIWKSAEEIQVELDENGNKIIAHIPDEVYELVRLQNEVTTTADTLRTIRTFVGERIEVNKKTPSRVPLVGHITSLYGWRRSPFGFGRSFHTGIDIAAPEGTPVRATAPGVVEKAGWGGGYGKMVIIKHEYGFSTVYAHNSRLAVQKGDRVYKGQVICYVGKTGSSTGNHCHYEVRLGNVAINPYPYMRDLR